MKTEIIALSLALSLTARAQVPGIINYQGRIVDGGTNFNGTGLFEFALISGGSNTASQATATAITSGGFVTLYTVTFGGTNYPSAPVITVTGGGGSGATGQAYINAYGVVTNITAVSPGSGYSTVPTVTVAPPPPNILYTNYWSNDGTPMGQPSAAVSLTVTKGLYSVGLGDTTVSNMTGAIPAAVFNNSIVQLRVWFNDGVNGFLQMAPDQRIGAAGYALVALNAQSAQYAQSAGIASNVPNGVITSAQLASNSVTAADLGAGAVTTAAIATGAVTATQLASNTITAAQVAAGYGLVPSGALVLSSTPNNPGLVSAGFGLQFGSILGVNWTNATIGAPWVTRQSFGAVAFNAQILVMGGYSASNGPAYLNDVWSSSNGVNWVLVSTNGLTFGSKRSGLGAVTFNGQIWAMGGYSGFVYLNDVWESANGGGSWTYLTNAPWSARANFGLVPFNGQLWLLGGYNGSYLNDVWSSSNGVTWVQATNAAPWSAREYFGAVALDGQLWVMGGATANGLTNDVWSSSNGMTWVQVTNAAPWSVREYLGAVALNNQMWVMGGCCQPNADVWSSSNGVNWVEVNTNAAWGARSRFGIVTLNSQLWVMGGQTAFGETNDVWDSQTTTNMLGGYYLYQKQ